MYTTKRGEWPCEMCGDPVAQFGTSIMRCAVHWNVPPRFPSDYFLPPIILNTYQATRLLNALENCQDINTGDWWGELQILLRNNGATTT